MAKILICDDAAFMRMTLVKIVEGAGHTVVDQAGNGRDCILKFKEWHPDIILMDITMPDMDGIEATKEIVALDPTVKIIMVSAMGQQEKVFAAISAGAKDFVVKPFEPHKIVECIGKYV